MPNSSFSILPFEDNERISRFLTDEDHFIKEKERVRHAAFKPRRSTNNLSAYRTKNLSDPAIWDLARKEVTKRMSIPKEVLGRADVPVHVYKDLGLILNPDGIPHPRHINVENWPSEQDAQLQIRKELANNASLVLK